MASNHFMEKAPPMWWIACGDGEASTLDLLSGQLHMGSQTCFLDEIVGYDVDKQSARDNDGLKLAGMGFFILAALFLNTIVMFGWPWRFWIGVGFCGFFAVVSFIEATQIKAVSHYRLEVFLVDGSRLVFSSADIEDVSRLISVLDEAIALNGLSETDIQTNSRADVCEGDWVRDRAA
ncbi:MAG: hypothetical protein AAFV69_05160 [Pseudomonadota bacterium]